MTKISILDQISNYRGRGCKELQKSGTFLCTPKCQTIFEIFRPNLNLIRKT